jgi:hypothetical protein
VTLVHYSVDGSLLSPINEIWDRNWARSSTLVAGNFTVIVHKFLFSCAFTDRSPRSAVGVVVTAGANLSFFSPLFIDNLILLVRELPTSKHIFKLFVCEVGEVVVP